MMMTESYYHGVEYEPAYRSPHRATPSTAHYNRAGPYGYYDHGRYHTRQHFEEQQAQDGELNNQIEQSARRRIALAVGIFTTASRIVADAKAVPKMSEAKDQMHW